MNHGVEVIGPGLVGLALVAVGDIIEAGELLTPLIDIPAAPDGKYVCGIA